MDAVSLADMLFERFEVAVKALALGVVAIDRAPAVVGVPAVDAVGVALAFVEGDIAPQPFELRKGAGSIVSKDAAIKPLGF